MKLPLSVVGDVLRVVGVNRAGGLKEGEHIGSVRFEFRIDGDGPGAVRLGDDDG